MYLSEKEKGNIMWAYNDSDAMSVTETYFFETKEEAYRFIRMATQRNMEEYPDEPDMWPMIGENSGMIFEVSPIKTAEEAFAEWFGE
jgi:hypothetical protein